MRINECKTKHVFDKKAITQFDKKISNMAEKEHLWREESVTADPEVEDPNSNDSKKTLSLRTLKRILSMRNLTRTLITVKPNDNAINEHRQELQDPQWLLRRKLTFFGFLVMVYNRVDDGDKFSTLNFGLERLHFHATSHLKIEAKVFFS